MSKRETNYELLRIVSMYMIIMLHYLGFGKLLTVFPINSAEYIYVNFLEALAYVAVNCYCLIGSYFLVNSKFKFERVVRICLKVTVFSVVIFLCCLFTGNIQLNEKTIIKMFFPNLSGAYWFSTAYVFLCLIHIFLNKIISDITVKQYRYILVVCFLFFSVLPFVFRNNYNVNYGGGYGLLWIITLYLIAGYLRLYFDFNKYSKKTYLLIYLICATLLTIAKIVLNIIKPDNGLADYLYNYSQLTIVIQSVALFCLFQRIEIKNNIVNKLIFIVSPLTFGVYLFHENYCIRDMLWQIVPKFIHSGIIVDFLMIPVVVLLVFLTCLIISYAIGLIVKYIEKLLYNSEKYRSFIKKINKFMEAK